MKTLMLSILFVLVAIFTLAAASDNLVTVFVICIATLLMLIGLIMYGSSERGRDI